MKWISLMLVSLLALSFACAPTVIEGKKVDSAKLKEMTVGLTSKAQVEQTFGKPARVETASPGVGKSTSIITGRRIRSGTRSTPFRGRNSKCGFNTACLMYYKLRSEGVEPIFKQ